MPMEAIGIRPIERPQTPSTEGVTRRGDGSSSSGFTPQTNVSLKTAIQDMAGILSKIGTTQDAGMEKMPQDLQKIVQNIMRQAFSMEETLGQGIGSTLESQRFSMEQLTAFSRMLTQLGALTEKGFSTEISDNLQALLTNLKNYVLKSEGSQLSPVLLNKTSFELLDTKITMEDLSQTLQLLLSSAQTAGVVPAPGQPVGDNEALGFLKQLVQYFMPRPQSEEASAEGRQPQGQQGEQTQEGQQSSRDGQQTTPAMRDAGQSTAANRPAGQQGQQAQTATQNGQPTAQQNSQGNLQGNLQGNSQGTTLSQNGAGQPVVGNNANQTPQNAAQTPQNANQTTQNGGGQPMANTAGQSAQPQTGQMQSAPTGQSLQQTPTDAAPQTNAQGQPTQTNGQSQAQQTNGQGQPTQNMQNAQNAPQGQPMPQAAQGQSPQMPQVAQNNAPQGQTMPQNGQGQAENQPPQTENQAMRQPGQPISTMEVRQAKAQMMAQPLQNTPQTMDTLKNVAQFLLKNADVTPEDAHLLQNFVNGSETVLSDKEARQLQTLLRICQQNVPTTVQQAAIGQNMPDLPKLWAFMQLCDMVVAKKMSARQLKKAGKDVADFALSMRNSLGNENSGGVQSASKGRSISFLLPLFMGDNEKAYPSYINVYDEEEMDWEAMRPRKETWFRVCVLTDNIGAVDITCRVYEGLQLDIRVFFSDREAARDFVEVMPEVRRSLRNTDMQLNDFSIGVAGMKERVAG